MEFPFEERFKEYLKNEAFLADSTINDLTKDINRFFLYLKTNSNKVEININEISELDIKDYLGMLQIKKQIKNSTYNKILTHLNRYFVFLFENNLSNKIPTLSLKGLEKNPAPTSDINWTNKLINYLQNEDLSFYTRLTLLLLAHFYSIKEIIEPNFYKVLVNENWNDHELLFLHEFENFHSEFEELQQSKSLYLKQKINLSDPTMSLAGLHKILKKDSKKIDIPLKPSTLYQDAIISYIKNNQHLSDIDLCKNLRISKDSLNYYRSILK